MTAREDALNRAAEAMCKDNFLGGHVGFAEACHARDVAEVVLNAVAPPGHVVIAADPLAAVLDYVLDGQGDLTDVMAAAQRLTTALDAWTEQL